MENIASKKTYPFLKGGGEMGERIRCFGWEAHALGEPDQWPQSLRTTVSIILNSKFPMFLFWGSRLTCFYNDAFRPSLGNEGKHPFALGASGYEVWPEIWDVIKPLIDQVLTKGEAVWSEDQLIPFYRNGKIEEIYWTFSYSPVYDETGEPAGVFVTCLETTRDVQDLHALRSATKRFQDLLMQAPVPIAVFRGPDFIVELANDAYLPLVGKSREGFVGLPLFEALPETRDVLENLLNEVLQTGQTFTASEFGLVIHRNNRDELCYFNWIAEPLETSENEKDALIVVVQEITEEVMARKKAEKSEAWLKAIIQATPECIKIVDADGRLQFMNNTGLQLIDSDASNLSDLEVYDLIVPEHREQWKINHQRICAGESLSWEFDIIGFKGTRRSMETYAVPLEGPNGISHLGVTRDISQRKLAEEAISRFKFMSDNATDFIGMCSLDGKPFYINKAGLELVGLDADAITEISLTDFFFPGDAELIREQVIPKVLEQGRDEIEIRFRHFQTGDPIWMRYNIFSLTNAQGEVYGFGTISRDITGQREFTDALAAQVTERTRELEASRQEIQRSAERLNAVFNQSQSGMFTFAPVFDSVGEIIDFRFVITNPTFASYVGQQPEVLNGALGSTWFPGYLHNGVFDIYKQTYLTGQPARVDVHYNVDQHDLYLDLMSNKVGDEVLVTFTDYTELKRTQLQLEKSVEELKRSNANLEEFAYAASHDLKEPIRKIHYFSERLKNSLENRMTELEQNTFSRMEMASHRMNTLIDDLLEYSQIGLRLGMMETVDLDELMKQVLADLDLEIEQKQAQIEVAPLFTMHGYPRQLQQVFQNLISNALKYKKVDEIPRISIRCRKLDAHAQELAQFYPENGRPFYEISLSDNGIGFDQKDAARIFNIFTRLHGNSEYRGTGVGLSIVRKVMENHQGFVVADSTPGEGSTFHLYFPA